MEEEITIYRSVPTVFRNFVGFLKAKELVPKLRVIFLAGESVSKKDVELYERHFPADCILICGIGPTETQTFRHYFIDKETQITTNTVPLGYPVEDMEVLLLDDDGHEVGPNEIGEIAVRGRYLSLGYWRNPDLTQAVFLPDPEGGDKRIYRTGDLGCLLPDGCLEHLGRKDFQVKIRGNRVETAEVEAALLALGDVKDAAVVAKDHISGTKTLVAYLVPKDQPLQVSTLRRSLAEMLPSYMLPAVFVMLESLPVTGSGKVDRRALPEPDGARPDLEPPFVLPRTPIEQELATIWFWQGLGLDEVGIHDDFLELGGNSLLAGLVISRVINTFRVDLPLHTLFETANVAAMASTIVQNIAKQAGQEEIEGCWPTWPPFPRRKLSNFSPTIAPKYSPEKPSPTWFNALTPGHILERKLQCNLKNYSILAG